VSVHYILPTAIFFLAWLIIPRIGFGKHVANSALVILAVSSALSLWPQLTRTNWQTNIPLVRFITNSMKAETINRDLKNVNLAVLASPDNNIYGRRYRDVLLVNDIRLRTKDEYQYSDHLFVVSLANENTVREDPAYEMHFFRQGELLKKWTQPGSEWKLYLFNRSPR